MPIRVRRSISILFLYCTLSGIWISAAPGLDWRHFVGYLSLILLDLQIAWLTGDRRGFAKQTRLSRNFDGLETVTVGKFAGAS
jgi:hypothetical protein